MTAEISEFLDASVKEVTQLRYSLPRVGPGASSLYILEVMAELQHRADRIEELLGQVGLVRGKLKRQAALDQAILDDAWDRASKRQRSNAASRVGDYVAAKDRYADSNLEVFEERRAARASENISAEANDAYEYIKAAHFGLNSVRQDLRVMVSVNRVAEISIER